MKSGNACYHSIQNLLSYSLLSKNLKIKVNKTIILPILCMGEKTDCSHWEREVGWGCFRIGCWGENVGQRGTRWLLSGEKYIMKSLMICTSTQSYSGDEIENIETARVCSTNGDRRELYGVFWWKPDGKKLLGKADVVGRIKLRCFLKKCNVRHGLDRTGSR